MLQPSPSFGHPHATEQLIPNAFHNTEQNQNNRVERFDIHGLALTNALDRSSSGGKVGATDKTIESR